jgi:hypothetical protein
MPQACGWGNVSPATLIMVDLGVGRNGGEAGRGMGNVMWLVACWWLSWHTLTCSLVPPPTLTNQNKAIKCHSVPPSFYFLRQTAKNQNIFSSIGIQQHIKGRIFFLFLLLGDWNKSLQCSLGWQQNFSLMIKCSLLSMARNSQDIYEASYHLLAPHQIFVSSHFCYWASFLTMFLFINLSNTWTSPG